MIVLELKGESGPVRFVRFSPDGCSLIASPVESELRIWRDLLASKPPEIVKNKELPQVYRAEFTGDGRLVLMNHALHLMIRDLAAHTERRIKLWGDLGGENSGFLITPDGKHFVAAQSHHHAHRSWMTCRPVDDPTVEAAVWFMEFPRSVFLSPTLLAGDRFLVTETWQEKDNGTDVFRHAAVVRSLRTGKVLSETAAPELDNGAGLGKYPASPDGSLFVHFKDSWAWVHSTADFSRPLVKLRSGSRKQFTAVAFHPSGKHLAVTSNDATVKLYDTTSWKVARTFTWEIGAMNCVAFSPDGTLAVAGSDTGKVVVWDVDV